MSKSTRFSPQAVTLVGVMSALATVLYLFLPEIPLVAGVSYLKIDVSDIPAILLGVLVNPSLGIWVEVFKNLIHLLKSTTMGIGELMNIGIGTTIILGMHYVLPLASRWTKKHPLHPFPYLLASAVTIALTVLAGWILNAALTPLFYAAMGFPLTSELLLAGVWGSTLLNAVKAALNLLPFYPLFLACDKALSAMKINS